MNIIKTVDNKDTHEIIDKIRIFQNWIYTTVKPVLSSRSKSRPKLDFQDRLSLNASQKYCRMLQGEHSAIFSIFIKLPYVINIFVLSIFERLLKAGFTVLSVAMKKLQQIYSLGIVIFVLSVTSHINCIVAH